MTNGPLPQPYSRVLASGDFEGMVQWVKEFIVSGRNGGGRLAQMAQGTVAPYTLTTAPAIPLPETPTITYTGPAAYPLNQLEFASSSFAAPQGSRFAAMQWRLGEIYDPSVPGFKPGEPWRYEITGLWSPEPVSSFTTTTPSIPASGLAAGRTYRARVRHQDDAGRWSHWSAPLEFQAGSPTAGNLATHLVISEIMYNPPAPEGGDAAYIELMNIHPSLPLDLTGVEFTAGITFTFPLATRLAPGGRLLVVENAAVFSQKFGADQPVVGTYAGSLANEGERLTLSLGGASPLRDFFYQPGFPWPTTPNNRGASLVLIAPETNPDHSNPLHWRASSLPTPGTTDTVSYAQWKSTHSQAAETEDTDHDGLTTLEEYALGGDPAIASQSPLPVLVTNAEGQASLRFSKPLTHDATDWQLESSQDLLRWSPSSAPLIQRTEQDGMETFVFDLPPPPTPGPVLWRMRFRLR
jgi:hypothetical protein